MTKVIWIDLNEIINEIKKSQDKEECLKKVYNIMIEKYHGNKIKTFTKFFNIFEKDTNKLWDKNWFMHCTNINYLMRILLVKSGFFKEEDIQLKWTLIWYILPHQYLQVKLNNKWINIDVWAYIYGIKFWNYAHWFNTSILK